MGSDPLRHHGDRELAELRALGLENEPLVDFAVNVSFVGPHPSVVEALRAADPASYPDRGMWIAREAVAATASRPATECLVGAGAAELLWAAVRALARSGERMLVLAPTFSEPAAAARAAGVEVHEARAHAASGFVHEAERVNEAIERLRPRLVSLSRPNNPAGSAMAFEDLRRLVEAHRDVCFLVDESFLSLSLRHAEAASTLPPNALRFRSMTKDHALAGVRIGAVFGDAELLARVDAQRPPWIVSNAALDAAVAASRASAHVAEVRGTLLSARGELEQALRRIGVPFTPSVTPYLLCEIGDADAMRDRLLRRHGILVRSCASFGLPHHVRLAARPTVDVERLASALIDELPRREPT